MVENEGAAALPGDNLPMPLTSLVGRRAELERIGETMRKCRLITLTGPGGVGKTRLALELARRQIGRRAGGVWLVDLASAPQAPDVAAETARTLDVRSRRDTTLTEALQRYLADRDPLLVLDNCEHVVEASAQLAAGLLASCPNVWIMATSREVLDVSGEHVWRLEPLDADDARRLFVERARARRPEFVPDERAEGAIGRICERLDRLPLAIELAAARVGVMSAEEILAGLESRLGALGGGRLAPPRHRTVRATVEWSHKLLDRAEQEALRNLAVFVGGFDARGALAVAPGLTLELLARLVDKSLVSVSESPTERFHLVGYSAGGASSLAFAASHPERLLSLALIEPAWLGNRGLSPEEQAVQREFDRIATLPPDQMMPAFVAKGLAPGVEPPPSPPGPPPPWMATRPAGLRAL